MSHVDDLRVFERVASLRSFSAAARALDMPKASVSRSIARLEARIGLRLFQRTTRAVAPTQAAEVLRERSADILARVEDAFDYVGGLGAAPRGRLRISAGIGFGLNVLSDLLPRFLEAHPEVEVDLDMTSRNSELVAESIDVAIRMGPLAPSSLVATRLGAIPRHLCASPAYLRRRGTPETVADLARHDLVEFPGTEGRPRTWIFTHASGEQLSVEKQPRVSVNDAVTIHRLLRNGVGLGCIAAYLCAPDVASGRLVLVLEGWNPAPIEVSILFPSNRELSPVVRAFVDFVKHASRSGQSWQSDPLRAGEASRRSA